MRKKDSLDYLVDNILAELEFLPTDILSTEYPEGEMRKIVAKATAATNLRIECGRCGGGGYIRSHNRQDALDCPECNLGAKQALEQGGGDGNLASYT